MNILFHNGMLSTIDLHQIIKPSEKVKISNKLARQKISEMPLPDIAFSAKDYSFDCAVLQASALEEKNFKTLKETVRELRAHLPVGILNHSNVSLTDEFLYVANGGKYPVRIKDMQQEGARAELPAFLASLSGAFHGNENPILDLGNGYTLDRVQRQLFDPNGDTVNIKSTAFRMLEYLAFRLEKPVSTEDLQSYIWGATDGDIDNIHNLLNVMSLHLRTSLTQHHKLSMLGKRQGVPCKFICLSEYSNFAETFQKAIEKLDESLNDQAEFIVPLSDGHKLLRVGGLRFHTAYPMLSVDSEVISLTKKEWKAMVSIVKSGTDGVSKENLELRDNAYTDKYIFKSGTEAAIISKVRAKISNYGNIIPRMMGRKTAIYKIDLEACEVAKQAYFARVNEQSQESNCDTYSP